MNEQDRLFSHPDYYQLKHDILNQLDGTPDILRLPKLDVDDSLHERVVTAVRRHCKLSIIQWEGLTDARKIACMQETLEYLIEHEWLTLQNVARGFGWITGKDQKRPHSVKVARLVGAGDLRDNHKTGKPRRISRSSLEEYCKREGVFWDESETM